MCAAGLPLGFALFGRRHAAGWIAGAALGYGLVAFGWAIGVQAGITSAVGFLAIWAFIAAATGILFSRRPPAIALPAWTRRQGIALLGTLFVAPALTGLPFLRLGEQDDERRRRYRAYFTADYLWHVALTAELAKLQRVPSNPYLESKPLNYYWTYFKVPAVISALRGTEAIDRNVAVNAICSAVLFVSCIYIAGWIAVPRAGPVAIAVTLAVVAASAEGLYGAYELLSRGQPLTNLRRLNIDAISAWSFGTLTIDSLPRSLWYTPQHAFACATGLIALAVLTARDVARPAIAAGIAGVALAISVACSPFMGGMFALVYGLSAVWIFARQPAFVRRTAVAALAAVPVVLALAWCAASGTFESAQGNIDVGLSERAAKAPMVLLLLSLGPMMLAVAGGLYAGRRCGWRWQPAIVALAIGLVMLYFVTLTREPVWIGWRAGQIILVTIPGIAAAFFAALADRGRRALLAAVVIFIALLGVPTTAIDLFNASDVENQLLGPGFRWTVTVPRDTEYATTWIRRYTPRDAVVQMSIAPRGRETWTLIPSFAQRRMAAGMPISLVRIPEYTLLSRQADAMYAATDAEEGWRLARSLGIDYVYLDAVERRAFDHAAIDKFTDPRFFVPVFWKGDAQVVQVK